MEGARGDVALEEFLVDQIDDGGDQLFEIFRSTGEGFDVGWTCRVR